MLGLHDVVTDSVVVRFVSGFELVVELAGGALVRRFAAGIVRRPLCGDRRVVASYSMGRGPRTLEEKYGQVQV